MSDDSNNSKWLIVIILLIVLIVGISIDMPGLSVAAGLFILYAIFLD